MREAGARACRREHRRAARDLVGAGFKPALVRQTRGVRLSATPRAQIKYHRRCMPIEGGFETRPYKVADRGFKPALVVYADGEATPKDGLSANPRPCRGGFQTRPASAMTVHVL